MTLNEAIERIGEEVEWALPSDDLKSLEAVRLGGEALKAYRESPYYSAGILLPGETRETEEGK